MAKSRNSNKSKSLSRQAWKKLKKNKIAVFGMVIISASFVVAILGPLIQPDDTPDANEMALQLTTKKPGFTVKTLRVTKNQEEINSQILYSEPKSLNTNKDLPTVSKNSFKKGVYY